MEENRSVKQQGYSMDEIIVAIGELAEDHGVLESAVAILDALRDRGAVDVESALDILHDYDGVVKERDALHRRYEIASRPIRKDGIWHCPRCNHRTHPKNTHCRWCGKKLGGFRHG